jgi:Protein of unknown function (DUF2637)
MIVAVLTVVAVSGLVSYSDIHGLVVKLGDESPFIAAIFPLCIDCIIAAAGLTLLFCGRYGVKPWWFVHGTLWFGILSTLTANCAHGMQYGWRTALIDAWPACSLTLATELVWFIVAVARELDTSRTVFVVDKPQGPNADELTKVAEIIANNHDVSSAEIARRLDLPYPKVLKLTKDARRLLNGSHLSVIG